MQIKPNQTDSIQKKCSIKNKPLMGCERTTEKEQGTSLTCVNIILSINHYELNVKGDKAKNHL